MAFDNLQSDIDTSALDCGLPRGVYSLSTSGDKSSMNDDLLSVLRSSEDLLEHEFDDVTSRVSDLPCRTRDVRIHALSSPSLLC